MSKSFIIKIIIICLLTINAYAIEKIVLFGDSLMAGYGLSNDNSLPVVLQRNLDAKGYNVKIINGSVSGSTSSGGLNRADWTLTEPDIDLIILCLGGNDMLRGIQPTETKSNLEKIIKNAQDKNIEIILAGMIAPTSHGFNYKKNFDKIFPDLAKKFKIRLIPFLLEGVAMEPEFNLSDGMHPNAKGTLIISRTLEEIIIKTLKKKN